MKALSIQQPWAWFIVNGFKPVENRTWATKYRGPLLIHAGKKFDIDGHVWIFNNFAKLGLPVPPELSGYEQGGIVGVVDLVDCVTAHHSPWFFGPYGHVYQNANTLLFMPCNGQLGLFNVEYKAA